MGWLYIRVPPMNGDVAHWRSISLNAAGPEQSGEGLLHLKMPDGTWVEHVAPDTAGSHRLRLNTWGDWEIALFMGSKGVLWQNTAEGGTPGELVTVGNSGGASGDAFGYADLITYTDDAYQGQRAFLVPSDSAVSWFDPTHRNFPDLYVRFYMKATVAPTGYVEDFCWPLFTDRVSTPVDITYNTQNMIMAVWNSPTTWELWFDTGEPDGPLKQLAFPIPSAQWVRIELHFGGGLRELGPLEARVYLDPTSTTPSAEKSRQVDWRVYLGGGNWRTGTMAGIAFGRNSGGDVFDNVVMDGLAVSNTGWIGP